MIRQSSIALAELIAVTNPDVVPSDIIEGLNDESVGAVPYSENFRKEIVATTSADGSEHTTFMSASSDRLAEIITEAMENISTFGKPFATLLSQRISAVYNRSQLPGIAGRYFKPRFTSLDDSFFDSELFPTSFETDGYTYDAIDLNMLGKLTFDYPTNDQVVEFVGSSYPDIVEVLRDRDSSASNAAEIIGNLDSLKNLLVNNNGVFNFNQLKSTDSELLLKIYVILTRMYGTTTPVPWLKQGSLDDYRQYVSFLWKGLTRYILRLKKLVTEYRQRELVIVEPRLPRLLESKEQNESGVMLVDAEATIYYTDAYLEKVTSGGNSLSEVLLGYYWARLRGVSVTINDVIADPARFQEECRGYYLFIHTKLRAIGWKVFVKLGLDAIVEYISGNELLAERSAEIREKKGVLLNTWVAATFSNELEMCYNQVIALKVGGSDDAVVADGEVGETMSNIIMSSQLVPQLLRALNCNIAAQLLEDTFITQAGEDNVVDQRERLHVAVINFIVGISLE